MSDFGIVCETNPIHNGHKYLIDMAKKCGADRVVCVMSGNTVQRGEFAIVDKYIRARALIKCGADLVLELPFPWCSSSAEYFSTAGVEIIRHFCDTLIFGSECGDIETLKKAAREAMSEEFRREYRAKLENGGRAANVYYEMLSANIGKDLSSNDLLGVEYIRASYKLGADLNFITVTRKGDGYMDTAISDMNYPSATAVRTLWKQGNYNNNADFIPNEALKLYDEALKNNNVTTDKELDTFWLSFFRLHEGKDFEGIVGAESGLANRFCSKAREVHSAEELLDAVKNKRYTNANLRRFMLYCLAGVTQKDLDVLPVESILLAANAKGRALLSEKRKGDPSVKVITKPADINKELMQNIFSQRIDSVFTLARKDKLEADTYIRMRPYIE